MKQKDNKKDYPASRDNLFKFTVYRLPFAVYRLPFTVLFEFINFEFVLTPLAPKNSLPRGRVGEGLLFYLHQQQADGNPDNLPDSTDNADK